MSEQRNAALVYGDARLRPIVAGLRRLAVHHIDEIVLALDGEWQEWSAVTLHAKWAESAGRGIESAVCAGFRCDTDGALGVLRLLAMSAELWRMHFIAWAEAEERGPKTEALSRAEATLREACAAAREKIEALS